MSAKSIRSSWLGEDLTCRAKRKSGANFCIGPTWLMLSNDQRDALSCTRFHITKNRRRQVWLMLRSGSLRNDCPDVADARPSPYTAPPPRLEPTRCRDNGAAWNCPVLRQRCDRPVCCAHIRRWRLPCQSLL